MFYPPILSVVSFNIKTFVLLTFLIIINVCDVIYQIYVKSL